MGYLRDPFFGSCPGLSPSRSPPLPGFRSLNFGMDWRLGTMGFGYADWSGVFYPAGLKSSEYLSFYAKHFNSVELDTTFYATPDVARVKHWAASVPEDF